MYLLLSKATIAPHETTLYKPNLAIELIEMDEKGLRVYLVCIEFKKAGYRTDGFAGGVVRRLSRTNWQLVTPATTSGEEVFEVPQQQTIDVRNTVEDGNT